MTPVERRAIDNAIRQCSDTLDRAKLALSHLAQLLDGVPPELIVSAPAAPAPAPAARARSTSKLYDFNGQDLTCQQLADLAGCSHALMWQRLQKMTPKQAVAMGAPNAARRWSGEQVPSARTAPAEAAPAPRPAAPNPIAAAHKRIADSAVKLAADQPVVTPDGVQIQRAPAHKDRFYVDPATVPNHFGPIGHVEDTGSAVSRSYPGAR